MFIDLELNGGIQLSLNLHDYLLFMKNSFKKLKKKNVRCDIHYQIDFCKPLVICMLCGLFYDHIFNIATDQLKICMNKFYIKYMNSEKYP